MPHSRVKRVDLRGKSLDPVELLVKYHITGLRHSKNGYVTQIKHVQFGWMKPEDYYRLQKMHEIMPLLQEVIEGGYRVNSMIWSSSATVGAVGVDIPIPVGAALFASSVWNLYQEVTALQAGDPHWERLLWVAYSVFGPFGAVLQVLDTIQAALDPENPWIPAQLKPSAWQELYDAAQKARPKPIILPPPIFR